MPFSSFELTLPEGPFSALASNLPKKARYSFCGQKLTMPTTMIGQNGAVIEQKTKIKVAGCKAGRPKHHKKHKRKSHHKKHKRKSHHKKHSRHGMRRNGK